MACCAKQQVQKANSWSKILHVASCLVEWSNCMEGMEASTVEGRRVGGPLGTWAEIDDAVTVTFDG